MRVTEMQVRDARAVLARARALLLDFDGPVARVFAGLDRGALVDQLRAATARCGVPLPEAVAATGDPMAAFAWSVGQPAQVRLAVETVVRRHELDGARRAAPTAGLVELLGAARAAGVPVAVVTNNCPEAVAALAERVVPPLVGVPVAGRVPGRPQDLKPAPVLVARALRELGAAPGDAVLIGDSVTDVRAARAAGVRSIALVLRSAKTAALAGAGPDGLVTGLGELVDPWRGRGSAARVR
ncbi:MAG: HAD family hydrolase [Actinobacteria bacterium]|nr:HAD family hydrolase [Actinomycetota bacterium]